MVILKQREYSVLFQFFKLMIGQSLHGCPEGHTEGVLQLDLRYGNGVITVKKEDLIFVEGKWTP